VSTVRGVVTVVQEDRFRLVDDVGRGYLFTLGKRSGTTPAAVRGWRDAGVQVLVEYVGAPDMGAVASRVRAL
jgi:hypothetical protein